MQHSTLFRLVSSQTFRANSLLLYICWSYHCCCVSEVNTVSHSLMKQSSDEGP